MAAKTVDGLVASVNPVPLDPAGPGALDARARADLHRLLETFSLDAATQDRGRRTAPRAHLLPRRPVPRRVALAGLAAAVAAGAALLPVLGSSGGSAYAATPQLLDYRPPRPGADAKGALDLLTRRAASSADGIGSGRYAHVVDLWWSLDAVVDPHQVRFSLAPQRTDRWRGPHGYDESVSTFAGAATPVEPGARIRSGSPGVDESAFLRLLDPLASGDASRIAGLPLNSLSGDDAVLARQLGIDGTSADGPAQQFAAVEAAYQAMPVRAAVRAALLRYLQTVRGIQLTGTVLDRAGRNGIALSVDSSRSGYAMTHTLIFDRQDGRLLDSEDVLTRTAGDPDVRVPAVVGYRVLVSAGYTNRPDGGAGGPFASSTVPPGPASSGPTSSPWPTDAGPTASPWPAGSGSTAPSAG